MTRGRRWRAAVLMTALVLPAAGGLGEAASARDASERAGLQVLERMSDPQARLRSDGKTGRFEPADDRMRTLLARMPASRTEMQDPATYARLVHDTMRAFGMDILAAGPGERDALEETTTETVRYALGAGDLDADGLDDVLELEVTYDLETFEILSSNLRGRRGLDGTALWTAALDAYDFALSPAGDLTGDGRADLLGVFVYIDEPTGQFGCVEVLCGYGSTGGFRWEVQVLSGADGAPAWTKGYDATFVEGGAGAFLGAADSIYADAAGAGLLVTNAVVLPMLTGDLDGDGLDDVVIDAIDLAEVAALTGSFSEYGGSFTYADQIVTVTKAEVAAGNDGGTLHQRNAPPELGVAFLWPPGNTVGSATSDLIWERASWVGPAIGCLYTADTAECAGGYLPQITAEMIDGATFATAWRAERPAGTDGFFLPTGGDLNGDGYDDLTFIEFGEGFASVMISGASGTELWQTSKFVLGTLGVQDDVPLVLAIDDSAFFETLTFALERLDGRTGDVVFSTSHTIVVPGEWWELFILIELYTLPDSDGDGIIDIFVQSSTYAGPAVRVDTLLESGDDGATLYQRGADREFFGIPLGDFDGDGTTDLLDVDVTVHRTSIDFALGGRRLPSGDVLWTSTLRVYPSTAIYVEPTGDLSGAGGDDVIYTMFQDAPTGFENVVRASEASTDATQWQLGTLSVPPLPGTAAITGTITGEGEPFNGACVSVYEPEGGYLGTEIALPDGTYVFDELDAGSFKVEFGSCSFEQYAWEYWDDKPDFESADVVVVGEGAMVSGIDADLAPGEIIIIAEHD